jgi:hypothetical protein
MTDTFPGLPTLLGLPTLDRPGCGASLLIDLIPAAGATAAPLGRVA